MTLLNSSYLHDKIAVRSGAGTLTGVRSGAGTLTGVRSGAEHGLLSLLRLSVYQDASLGDFLLAPACPIEKV